tara:strand:+ start:2120 stop:2473 length:354 start_codon:yes stop_codon:yes gene_type:complete
MSSPSTAASEAPVDGLAEATSAPIASINPIAPTLRDLNPTGPKEINGARFMQLLPRDAIVPVYEAEYAPANGVELGDKDLVMGVSIDGPHRAYPLRNLRSHEMVNDELADIPILVTW